MDNQNKYSDRQYMNIVNDILDNSDFKKLEDIIHHKSNRLSHCLRVSYSSYKIAKFLRLDYESVARAGLLHDFFLNDNEDSDPKERLKTLVNHPKYALNKASSYFELNEIEKDIIVSHMFPISVRLPRFFESWIVNIVDDCVAVYEIAFNTKSKLSYATNLLLLFILSYLR